MDFVACKIALGGDAQHVLHRGKLNPVSWPEVRVLQQIHGEQSVFDAEFAYEETQNVQAEKMRLLGLYGFEAVTLCYPGQRPAMELQWPGDRGDAVTTKRPERIPLPERADPKPEPKPELEPIAAAEEDMFADPTVKPHAVMKPGISKRS
jgi:hypothetical protein